MDSDDEGNVNGSRQALLVEGDGRIADFLVKELSPLGLEVTVTQDLEVGAFLASTEAFELVILDLGPELIPTLDLLRFLHVERPLTPVIALTERDQVECRDVVLRAGAVACLTKPLVFEELREQVLAQISARSEATVGRNGASSIWILTDRRYLEQRMPTAVMSWLDAEGHDVRLAIADDGPAVSLLTPRKPVPRGSPWDGINGNDLVVARSRHPFALALLEEVEARGAKSLNPTSAVRDVRNKVRCTLALTEAGLPVPDTFIAESPQDLRRLPERFFPLVLKPFLGDNARGIRVVRAASELGELEWPEPFLLAQPYVDADGIDVKLYVADGSVWAVRKGSPLLNGGGKPKQMAVDSSLRDLALTCGATFGLRLYGLDVLESRGGPVVVDVNEFPNYSGIAEAPEVIGSLLLSEARGQEFACVENAQA